MVNVKQQQQGFTLIELLISLALFSILSLLVSTALHHSLTTYKHIKDSSKNLSQLAITEQLMQRDFSALQPRPITTANGHLLAPLLQTQNLGVEITTASRDNPGSMLDRSNLQRVRYELKNHQLIRTTWPTLDGNSEEKGKEEVLLSPVKSMRLFFIDDKGEEKDSWDANTSYGNNNLPRGLSVDINLSETAVFHGDFVVTLQKQGASS
jgi:general secretion pathway protein J